MSRKRGLPEKEYSPEIWGKAWENRKLVYHIQQVHFSHLPDHDEFLIDGLRGLCRAIELHDPRKGKLSTLAKFHIRSLIGRAVEEQRAIFHTPAHVRNAANHQPPAVIRETEDWSIGRCVARDDSEEDSVPERTWEDIEKALSRLPERQAEMIRRRFGLGQDRYEQEPWEIARDFGLNSATVYRAIKSGLEEIRKYIELKREGAAA